MFKTFKYRIYTSKKDKHLHRLIEVASEVWNHSIALHRRYYSRYGKTLNVYRLQRHITKLKKQRCFQHWNELNGQAIQDVTQRIDRSYKLFFGSLGSGRRVSPPSFRKRNKYRSFTLKQSGWKLLAEADGRFGNRIRIAGRIYKFVKSREIEGMIKRITIKRDRCGDLWLCFFVEWSVHDNLPTTGKSAGADFGLKTFLTLSDGMTIDAPQPFKRNQELLGKLQRQLTHKQQGSNRRRKARLRVAKLHRRIANQRRDWHFKTARSLLSRYDSLYLEDLNLEGMQRLWGRKISDLGYASFVSILDHLAHTNGKRVGYVDRYYPSSKICSACSALNDSLLLAEREWVCSSCGRVHDRDRNAAINIHRAGMQCWEGASSRG